MTGSWWLVLVGLVLQAAGASLALIGFTKTWRRHRGVELFWAPMIRWCGWLRDRLKAGASRVNQIVLRALRKPIPHRYVRAGDIGAGVDAGAIKATHGPVVPDLQAVADGLTSLSAVVDQLREDNGVEHERVWTALNDHSAKLLTTTRELAIGGLRLQIWGLLLITVGALLAGIPSLATISDSANQCPCSPSSLARPSC
ncbi:hypothetical protein ACWCQ1_47035 [Streptomyces sp. NPDC002144]